MSVVAVSAGAETYRAALSTFASSVTVLTVWDEGRPIGMTATAFSSVSAEPMLVLACVNRSTKTYTMISKAGAFGVNILGSSARAVAQQCSRNGRSKDLDRDWLSSGADWRAPALSGATAFLDCEVTQMLPAGSHAVVIGAVHAIGLADQEDDDPLIYFHGAYRQLQSRPRIRHLGPLPVVGKDLP